MKFKNIATLLLVLITMSGFAQFPLKGANKKDFQALFNSKVYIVKSGDTEMDRNTEAAFREYWKVTDYEMIPPDDLEEMIKDESKYFMLSIKRTVEDRSLSTFRVNKYFILTRGGYKSLEKINSYKWIFAFPMDIWGSESEISDMAYRMGINVKMMNETIQAIKTKEAKVKAGKSARDFMIDLYSGKAEALKDKTLLINESHVRPEDFKPAGFKLTHDELVHRASATETEIKESYPYKFEVVDSTTYYDAIANHRPGTAVVIPVASANLIYCLIDTETYDCLFYGYQTLGLSLKSKSYEAIFE